MQILLREESSVRAKACERILAHRRRRMAPQSSLRSSRHATPQLHVFDPGFLDDAAGCSCDDTPRTAPSNRPSPPRTSDEEVARSAIEELLAAGGSGAVATRDGDAPGTCWARRADTTWGANVWVESAGHAVDEPEAVRDLYGLAAGRWVEEGLNAHYAVVPTSDASSSMPGSASASASSTCTRSGRRLRPAHRRSARRRRSGGRPATTSARSPSSTFRCPPTRRSRRSSPRHRCRRSRRRGEWDEDLDNPAFATFVGELDGRVVGSAIGCSVELSSLHTGIARPDAAAHLGFAAVLPEARGSGVGTALGATCSTGPRARATPPS